MQSLLNTLCRPDVQAVVSEWFDLRLSGVCVVSGDEAETELRAAIQELFAVLMAMAHDQRLVRQAYTFAAEDDTAASGGATDGAESLLQRAQEFCLVSAFPDAVVALYLLRRKLRAMGAAARDERAVVTALSDVVALMAPGVSVLALWENNRAEGTQLWAALSEIMRVLDCHCPDAAAAAADLSPK